MPAAHALTTPPGQGDKQDLFVCFGKKISFFEDLYFDVLVFFEKKPKKWNKFVLTLCFLRLKDTASRKSLERDAVTTAYSAVLSCSCIFQK